MTGRNAPAQARMGSRIFSNGQAGNKFRPSLSPEKSLEKYTAMAKDAMSLGDKTLSENYLQHADHFMRIIEDKNKNRNSIKENTINKSFVDNKDFPENNNSNPSKTLKDDK